MKLLKRYIDKDGSGSVGLRLEQDEDLWHGEPLLSFQSIARDMRYLADMCRNMIWNSIQSYTGGTLDRFSSANQSFQADSSVALLTLSIYCTINDVRLRTNRAMRSEQRLSEE